VLNGHVATMRFAVDYGFDSSLAQMQTTQETKTPDEAIAKVLNGDMHQQIFEAVKFQVATALGPGFDVESLVIRAGSVEILAAIVAVAAFLRSYNDFAEQLSKAIENTRNVIRTILSVTSAIPRVSFNVQGSWFPGNALTSARERITITPPVRPSASVGMSRTNSEPPINPTRLLLILASVHTVLLLGIIAAIVITRR